jgi:hypothetical protein
MINQTVWNRRRWFVAWRRGRQRFIAKSGPVDFSGFRPIAVGPTRSLADPFPIEVNDLEYIFLEDKPLTGSRKGVISFCVIGPGGQPSPPQVALERDYHLSYPFLFQWDDRLYLIPESSQNQTIELYRALDFPTKWELDRIIFSGLQAVDTTLLEHQDRWWMFTNIAPPGGSTWDELYIFYADTPLRPWTPHPDNPVVSDVRRARPAGRIFRQGSELIRPSQDCSLAYGRAISLNRILTLTTTAYQEEEIGRITPEWRGGNQRTHTINSEGNLEVIDGLCLVSRFNCGRGKMMKPVGEVS